MRVVYSENKLNKDLWDRFVQNHPSGSIFQTPEYYFSFKSSEKTDALLVALIDDQNSEILGIIVAITFQESKGIKGYFSKRSIVMGAPLVKDNDTNLVFDLIQAYNKNIENKVIYSQFRNMHDMHCYDEVFQKCGYKYEEHLNILIDLSKSEEELWRSIHSKRRNEIRKAIKNGLEVKKLDSLSQLKEAYDILVQVYAHAGLPLMALESFEKVYQNMLDKDYFKQFGVFKDDILIGAMIVLTYKNRVYDWYAGSLHDYYKYCPNDIIPWQVFKISKSDGFGLFDFGGAGKPGIPYGVRDYKQKFGGDFVEYGRFTLIHKPALYRIGTLLLRLYRRINNGLR